MARQMLRLGLLPCLVALPGANAGNFAGEMGTVVGEGDPNTALGNCTFVRSFDISVGVELVTWLWHSRCCCRCRLLLLLVVGVVVVVGCCCCCCRCCCC